MKLRHKKYPRPMCCTEAGWAYFEDYHFETTDKKLAAALRKDPDIVEVRPPKKPEPAQDS